MSPTSIPPQGSTQSLALAAAVFLSTAALLGALPRKNKSITPPSCLCSAGRKNSKRKQGVPIKRVRFPDDVTKLQTLIEIDSDQEEISDENNKMMKKKLDTSKSPPETRGSFEGGVSDQNCRSMPTVGVVLSDSAIVEDHVDRDLVSACVLVAR